MSNPPSAGGSARVTQLKNSVLAAFDGMLLFLTRYFRVRFDRFCYSLLHSVIYQPYCVIKIVLIDDNKNLLRSFGLVQNGFVFGRLHEEAHL